MKSIKNFENQKLSLKDVQSAIGGSGTYKEVTEYYNTLVATGGMGFKSQRDTSTIKITDDKDGKPLVIK